VLHWTPLRGGLSYLPFGITIGAGNRARHRPHAKAGGETDPDCRFLRRCRRVVADQRHHCEHPLTTRGSWPAMAILGLFSGMCFPAIGNASLHQVTGQDPLWPSGVQNAVQQIGGALGLAVLVTIALPAPPVRSIVA